MPLGRTLRRLPAARLIFLGELVLLAREHLHKLDPQERRRVVQLVRHARGRSRNLSERDRRELSRLIEKAEPREFVKSAAKRVVGMRDHADDKA
jgi:hypothetical protein